MKYLKHYWIDLISNTYATEHNPIQRRHPEEEFLGLSVKLWMKDSSGIDVCLSTAPDEVSVEDVIDEATGKKSVQSLTEQQFNSVVNPAYESQQLASQATNETDEQLKAQLQEQSVLKFQEAEAALNSL